MEAKNNERGSIQPINCPKASKSTKSGCRDIKNTIRGDRAKIGQA